MKKIKNLTKTKTLICANLYDSTHYEVNFSKASFIDGGLALVSEFPETFKIVDSSLVHVTLKVLDLEHCFELYKHNEDKVILKTKRVEQC